MTDSAKGRHLTFTVCAVALLLILLNLYGYASPGSRNWGFHVLGFLPASWLVLYLLMAAAAAALVFTGVAERAAARAGDLLRNRPAAFIAAALCCFAAAAFAFRVKAPLLGDSFTFIRNYTDYYAGVSPLAPWHEPVSMHFFALALGAFGHADIWEIQDSFFAADLILGCAFILIVYLTAVRLFGRTPHGACAFLFLCAAPYMNFFLGYVEIYSFTLTALALFAYLALLVTGGKFPFPLLCAYGMFLVFVSYLNGLAWISIGYLGIAEYRKGNRLAALAGAGVSAALSLGILALADFDMTALVDQSPISHFLSVSADVSLLNEYSQAFTLFSWNHAVEVANYLALMSPFAVPVVAALAWDRPSRLAATPFTAFLAIVGASYLLLLVVVKIQQGMANDWDVMASFFYFIGLYLMVLLREGGLPSRDRAALLVLSMTFIHTLIYVRLNSTVEPKIRRIESFYDTAMISQLGHYTISLHLSRYYDSRGDSVSPVALWTRYSSFFPDDPRGYSNALDYLKSLPAPDVDSVMAVYDRWYSRDPLNQELRREYASHCLAAGNAAFAGGANDRARASYERAIRLDPRSAAAFNNLGSVLAEGGKTDSALAMFSKAVEIDPGYAAALYNLGQAYSDLGDRRRATDAMRRAAALGSAEAEEFLSATGKPAGDRHE